MPLNKRRNSKDIKIAIPFIGFWFRQKGFGLALSYKRLKKNKSASGK
jgi:predicted GNAT family acetyltransferase